MLDMRVGGRRVITVPAALAMGEAGSPELGVDANQDLIFVVELYAVLGDPPAPPPTSDPAGSSEPAGSEPAASTDPSGSSEPTGSTDASATTDASDTTDVTGTTESTSAD